MKVIVGIKGTGASNDPMVPNWTQQIQNLQLPTLLDLD
jgi:hypothetical protein